MPCELALVVSGASGMVLATRFAGQAARSSQVDLLHVVLTAPATQVMAHELGAAWASSRGFCAQLAVADHERAKLRPWNDSDLAAPIASGSHLLAGTVVLPCSAAMASALAHGSSRGLAQRAADVAIKEGRPLLLGIRETPMSAILLENLLQLARLGVRIVPPLPAFYLRPATDVAMETFVDHYVMRLFDLLGLAADNESLRWSTPSPHTP